MASIRTISNSPYWIACYRTPEGRQKNKSTRLPHTNANRKNAQSMADSFEELYKKKNCKDNLRRQFNSIAREIDLEASLPTVGEYFAKWKDSHAEERAPSTQVSYIQRLKQFEEYYGADNTMDSVNSTHALGFRSMIAKNASNSTANHAVKIMRYVFACAINEGFRSGNPFVMKPLVSDSVIKQAFTLEQVKLLMQGADPEWKSLIMFGVYTGQRLGDLVDSTWSNIDFVNETIIFTTKKTGRPMAIPASRNLWNHVKTLTKGKADTPLHPRAYAAKHRVNIGAVSKDFTRLMVSVGLCPKRPNNKKRTVEGDVSRDVNPLTFHSLRHSLASWLRDTGASESISMEIIGHDSVSVDRAYVHTDPKRMREALNKIELS